MKKVLIIAPRHYVIDLKDYYVNDQAEIHYLNEEKAEKSDLAELSKKLIQQNFDGYIGLADWSALYACYLNLKTNAPHPNIKTLAKLQDKLLSRELQSNYVKTPHTYLDSSDKILVEQKYPLFVKPRRSSMSFGASEVSSYEELLEFVSAHKSKITKANSRWHKLYDHIGLDGSLRQGLDGFVVESLLHHGSQLTLDGYVQNKKIKFFGFTKSVFLPNHISFKRFDYPHHLPASLSRKIKKHARKLIKGTGFNNSLFNIEYKFDIENKSFELIEFNTRPSSQFMYSIASVIGIHPLDVSVAIILDHKMKFKPQITNHKISSICIFRQENDAKVDKLPSPTDLDWFFKQYPKGRWNVFAHKGEKLSDHPNDSHTFRYAEMIVLHPDSLPARSFEDELKIKFDESIKLSNINTS